MQGLEFFLVQLSVILGWTGLVEWRIRNMQSHLESKIKDREELTKYKIEELKENVVRLESKIDKLINMQLKRRTEDGEAN